MWGTCAGLVMLASSASATKKGGQALVGGLDVHVRRNGFGRQVDSFVADLDLAFLAQGGGEPAISAPFRGVFIRAPVVEKVLPASSPAEEAPRPPVQILGTYHRSPSEDGSKGEDDIVALRQGNVFGTSFHPELTADVRIHVWWLKKALEASGEGSTAAQ